MTESHVGDPKSGVFRLMAVHAHPDDESSKGAATTAKYAAEGNEVLVVTLTGGERGDILNPAMDRPGIKERMTEVRREEMAKAAEALGDLLMAISTINVWNRLAISTETVPVVDAESAQPR